jgi:hypothetical protein
MMQGIFENGMVCASYFLKCMWFSYTLKVFHQIHYDLGQGFYNKNNKGCVTMWPCHLH